VLELPLHALYTQTDTHDHIVGTQTDT